MRARWLEALGAGLWVGCAAGCAAAQLPVPREAPGVQVQAAEPYFFSDTRGALVLRLSVHNEPGALSQLRRARFELQLQGRYFASGTELVDQPLPAGSTSPLVLQFPLAYARTPLSTRPKAMQVAVRGALSTVRAGAEIELPFQWSGEVLEEPALELQNAGADED